jgi:hypothetical protein
VAAINDPARLVDAAGITVELRRGGSGASLLVIHGELGVPGWLEGSLIGCASVGSREGRANYQCRKLVVK